MDMLNQNQLPVPPQQNPSGPWRAASIVGDHVRAGLKITAWVVVAAFGAGAAYVCLRVLVWGVMLIHTALGM